MLSLCPPRAPPSPAREGRVPRSPGPVPPSYHFTVESEAKRFGAPLKETHSPAALATVGHDAQQLSPLERPVSQQLSLDVKTEQCSPATDPLDVDGAAAASSEQQKQVAAKRRSNILYCSKCQAHGEVAPLKGHKKVCPFRNCGCIRCNAVDLDRFCNLTSHRICKLRRRDGDQPVEKRKYFSRPESQALIGTEILTKPDGDDNNEGAGEVGGSSELPKGSDGSAEEVEGASASAGAEGPPGLPLSLATLRNSKVEKYCRKCLEHGVTLKIYRKEHDRQCWFRTCECPKCVIINEWRRIQTDRKKIANQKRREQRLRQKQLLKVQVAGSASASSPAPVRGGRGSRASVGDDLASDGSLTGPNEEFDNSSTADGSGSSLQVAANELEASQVGMRMSPSMCSPEPMGSPPNGLPLPTLNSLGSRAISQTELASSQPIPQPAAASLPVLNPAAALLCGPYYQMVVQCLSQLIAQALLQQVAAPMSGTGANVGLSALLQQLQTEQLAAILKMSGTGSEAPAVNLTQLAQLQEQSQSLLPQQLLAQLQAQALGANTLVGSPAVPLQLQLPALAALTQLQTQTALPLPLAAAPPQTAASSAPGQSPAAGLNNQTEIANLLLTLASGQPYQQLQSQNSPQAPRSNGSAALEAPAANRNAGECSNAAYNERIESSRKPSAGALGARSLGLSISSDRLAAGAGVEAGIGKRTRATDASAPASRTRGSSRKRGSAGTERELLLPPPQLVPLPRVDEPPTGAARSVGVDD